MRLLRGVSPCGEELWLEIMGIYLDDTDEVELLRDKATPAQRACSFLAMINLKYAEAAIVLAEQGWVLPASALTPPAQA